MKNLCAALFGLLLASAAQAQSVSWPPPAGALAFLCVYNASPPTLTTTNVAFAQCDSAGNLRVSGTVTSSLAGATSNASSGVATSATNIPAVSYNYGFNGTTWDQLQVDASKNLKVLTTGPSTGGGFPNAATPITISATGTTAATVATLAATTGKTTYICGFSITSDATAGLAGNATVVGVITGTMTYIQGVGVAPAVAALTQNYAPCIPASTTNTTIVITSAAAGVGGGTAVNAWGYQQ